MSANELLKNTAEIIDSAHNYCLELSRQLATLTKLEDQVRMY